jgi:hypothetical protein
MIAKIDRDFVAADLAAVESLLARMTPKDALTSMSLASRRDELREELASMTSANETRASAALFFSGRPVVANRGIESEFGTEAIGKFQDIVTKVFALQHTGNSLGQRGAVPGKELSKLHITNVVHGSFGFRLEELEPQSELIDSTLKAAVDETTRLMDSFGEADDQYFEAAVENIDNRVLGTIREFFELISTSEAAFRMVSDHFDKSFDRQTVDRAAERARVTTLREETKTFDGNLAGTLPYASQFEYVTTAERGVIHGKIDAGLEGGEIATLNRDWVGKDSRITVRMRQVVRGDKVAREMFTLLKIEAL